MKVCVLIPSYRGEGELRIKRAGYHQKQMEWLASKEVPVFVCSMEYKPGDYRSPHATYFDQPRMCAAGARNFLLNQFYESEFDYFSFLDDDAMLYPRLDGDNIYDLLRAANIEHFAHVDGFSTINPTLEPYNKRWEEGAELYGRYLQFAKSYRLKTTVFFFKNVWKHKRIKIYFDPSLYPIEDEDFVLVMVKAGLGYYKCFNLVMKEQGSADTSVIFGDMQGRRDSLKITRPRLVEKWSRDGVVMSSDGKVLRKGFMDRYFVHPNEVLVPKGSEPYRETWGRGRGPYLAQELSLF